MVSPAYAGMFREIETSALVDHMFPPRMRGCSAHVFRRQPVALRFPRVCGDVPHDGDHLVIVAVDFPE